MTTTRPLSLALAFVASMLLLAPGGKAQERMKIAYSSIDTSNATWYTAQEAGVLSTTYTSENAWSAGVLEYWSTGISGPTHLLNHSTFPSLPTVDTPSLQGIVIL